MNGYNEMFERAFQNKISLLGTNSRIDKWTQPEKAGCSCEHCVEKNSFRDDVCVVIQGHTAHIGEILENYKGYKNIIWSMDDTCSLRDYGLVQATRINPVVVKRPANNGFGNINLQVVSTVEGLKYAKELGAKYCIKVRSDMVFSPLHKFIQNASFDKLGFLYHATYQYNDFTKPFEPVNHFIKSFIDFHNLDKEEVNLTRDYVSDFCVTGPVDELISFFDYEEYSQESSSYEPVQAPAEYKFLLTICLRRDIELILVKKI